MTNPWTLTESQCAFKRRLATDALFTLGNGYLGCRGFFEEEQEGVEVEGHGELLADLTRLHGRIHERRTGPSTVTSSS